MAKEPPASNPQAPARAARLVNHDTVQVEFLIDDLIKQLGIHRVASASCNGCNNCSATIERPTAKPVEER